MVALNRGFETPTTDRELPTILLCDGDLEFGTATVRRKVRSLHTTPLGNENSVWPSITKIAAIGVTEEDHPSRK